MKTIERFTFIIIILILSATTFKIEKMYDSVKAEQQRLLILKDIYEKQYLKANTRLIQIDSLIQVGALTNFSTFEIKCK